MKKSDQKIAVTIDVTPEEAWKIIGGVSGVDKWLAPIAACRVENGKRYCTTEQGEFSEDILNVDHEQRLFEYAIPVQNMIPVQNIKGSMRVLTTDENQATVEWSWTFDVEETNEAPAKEMLEMIGNLGVTGIETLIKKNRRQAAAA